MDVKRVLVTGATGFIGSHLIKRLVQQGFKVGIIKRQNSDIWRIKDILSQLRIFSTDIRDTQIVRNIVTEFQPNAIIHLAAYYAVEHKPEDIVPLIQSNVLGTVNLLEAARINKVTLFINTSSCFVYKGNKAKLKEESELEPANLYALSKIHAEQACSYYSRMYGSSCVTLRVFPPFGPADHVRCMIPSIIKNFFEDEAPELTTGEQKRDWVYVDDLVDAYLSLLENPKLRFKHEVFNVGTGNPVSVKNVALRLKRIVGSDLEPNFGVIPPRKNEYKLLSSDITKAKKLLGWEPKTTFDEGLMLTVEWYKKHLVNNKLFK
ncbi:MAG: SDR family NAD(P)-dependent oxidoreductase [Methanobacteriota archaeon]